MSDTQTEALTSRRARALLHAATPDFCSAAALFQRAGLAALPETHDFYKNHRALNALLSLGYLAKTGERSRREYALTPTGLTEQLQVLPPPVRPALPVCRMCGRAGGHWSECPLDRRH